MRPWRALMGLLVLTGLILSGCMEAPQDGNETNDKADGNDTDDGDFPGPTDPDRNGTDGNHTKPEPVCKVEPPDHEVGSVDDIECAGHYTVLNEGSGETWEVPEWKTGDWWEYEIEVVAGGTQCQGEREEVTDVSETQYNASVYTTATERFECGGEPDGENQTTQHHLQDHLMVVMNEGAVAYNALFPLREDKSWVYKSSNDKLIEIDDVSHDPSYMHDTTLNVEAWHVKWTLEYDDITVEFEETWGVSVKNLLKQKITYTSESYTFIVDKTLEDSSYEVEGGLPVLKKVNS